jgi:ribosomal protein L37AE/L43A
MQEFRDGSFGPIEPAAGLFKRMARTEPAADLAVFHIGTRSALERMRAKAQEGRTEGSRAKARRKVAELEARVQQLEARLAAAGEAVPYPPADAYVRAIRAVRANAAARNTACAHETVKSDGQGGWICLACLNPVPGPGGDGRVAAEMIGWAAAQRRRLER